MKTYYGTFTDIMESDIIAIYGSYKYYFTSNFNKKKFIENIEDYVYLEELKIKNRYGINIELNDYLAVWFYKKVQKKGFKVEDLKTGKLIKEFNFKTYN